jgi:hypothetical protein
MTNEITINNISSILQEIETAFFDIPFGNSMFQTENFVIASQLTPTRAYRSIGLELHSKINNLQQQKFSRQLMDIELEELDSKISDPTTSIWDKKRAEIEKNKILSSINWADKLVNDTIQELNVLYYHFKSLPRYTREEFEASEKTYYIQRLERELSGITGAKDSVMNLQYDITAIREFERLWLEHPEISSEDLFSNIQTQLKELSLKLEQK